MSDIILKPVKTPYAPPKTKLIILITFSLLVAAMEIFKGKEGKLSKIYKCILGFASSLKLLQAGRRGTVKF